MKPCISCWAKDLENGVCAYCGTKNTQNENTKQTIYYIEKQNESIFMLHFFMIVLIVWFCFQLGFFFMNLSQLTHISLWFIDKVIFLFCTAKLILYINLFYVYFNRGKSFLHTLWYFLWITFFINVFAAINSSVLITEMSSSFYLGLVLSSLPLIIFIVIYVSNYKNIVSKYFYKEINDNKRFWLVSWIAVILVINVLRHFFSPTDSTMYQNPDFWTPVNNEITPDEFVKSTNQFDVMEKGIICKKAFGIRTTYDASLSSEGIWCRCSHGFYINLRWKCVSELVEPRFPTSQDTRIIEKSQIFAMQNLPMPEITSDDYADQRKAKQTNIFTGTKIPSTYVDPEVQRKKDMEAVWNKYITDLWEIDYSKYDVIYKETEMKFAYSKVLQKYVLEELEDWKRFYDEWVLVKEYIKNMPTHDPYDISEYHYEVDQVKNKFWDKPRVENQIINELNKIHLNK